MTRLTLFIFLYAIVEREAGSALGALVSAIEKKVRNLPAE
jgi:hypothetical protein